VAENQAGGAPWFHPAFEVFQETPYDVRAATSFSCQPWRGGTGGTLFQLNHWITRVPAPRPSDAALVNSYDFLMPRVRRCMRERHALPNLVAVDFYRTGDLLAGVDELNRERPVPVARQRAALARAGAARGTRVATSSTMDSTKRSPRSYARWIRLALAAVALIGVGYLVWSAYDHQAVMAWLRELRPLPFFAATALLPAL